MRAAVNFEYVAAFAYPDGKLIGLAQHGQVDVGSVDQAQTGRRCLYRLHRLGSGIGPRADIERGTASILPDCLRTREEIASRRFDKNQGRASSQISPVSLTRIIAPACPAR